jgi:hypothetical protein
MATNAVGEVILQATLDLCSGGSRSNGNPLSVGFSGDPRNDYLRSYDRVLPWTIQRTEARQHNERSAATGFDRRPKMKAYFQSIPNLIVISTPTSVLDFRQRSKFPFPSNRGDE